MSRSKRRVGTLTRPRFTGPPEGGQSAPEVELIQSLVLFLLVLDVVAYDRLVPPDRRNKIPSGPKVLSYEPSVALAINPSQMDCALALDVPHDLTDRVLRRNRQHHVNVVGQQMPFFDPALSVFRKLAENLPQVFAQLAVQNLAPKLRNENDVIFALPLRVINPRADCWVLSNKNSGAPAKPARSRW